MGGALYRGWVAQGLAPSAIVDPNPAPGLARPEDHLATTLNDIPDDFWPQTVVLAVKPQIAPTALPPLARRLPEGCPVCSIMAGLPVSWISAALNGAPVVRAMPNTPAAIGQGITLAYAGPGISPAQRTLIGTLLEAVGDVEWFDEEALIDAATAISGSGPAYVFLLTELLADAAVRSGLAPDVAARLARKTVSGSGALLQASDQDAAALRRAVTSPNGVTERALEVLLETWPDAINRAIEAAHRRAIELGSPPARKDGP
jgi:pyrroline-5-carboxylate reductase